MTAAKRVLPEKNKRGGQNLWAKKLKKDITVDTKEELTLIEIVTDLVVGATTGYDGRRVSEEMNELVTEYRQSKQDRPVEERSLFALMGQEGALTTEQRLSVAMMKRKPELGILLNDVEESAPEGLRNIVSQVRVIVRPAGAGMTGHRDSINLKLDRWVFTLLAGPSQKPPVFIMRTMSGPEATPAVGPYGPDELRIPKENGRLMVKGPNARGEEVRVVHAVEGGDGDSFSLVGDYYTIRTDGQPTTTEDRDRARRSVVDHASRLPPAGVTINPYADGLVLSDDAPRTTSSRRGTEANNAMVRGTDGKLVKSASLKGESFTVPPIAIIASCVLVGPTCIIVGQMCLGRFYLFIPCSA